MQGRQYREDGKRLHAAVPTASVIAPLCVGGGGGGRSHYTDVL